MAAPLLALRGIAKSFGTTRALADVDFALDAGEVHALVGENGAGKSTLLAILAGVVAPDAGTIEISGKPVAIASPAAAQALGIGTVFQELSLAGAVSVAENVFAGRAPTFAGFVRRHELRERTRAALAAFGVDIDVDRPVDRLPTGARQIVEIAKALSLDARILLLDEPTSALTTSEAGALFEMIRRLKGRGIGVVYVSHHMPEVFRIADRITVLRDGRRVMMEATSATSIDAVVEAMVGRTLQIFSTSPTRPPGTVALASRGRVDLELRHGEIVGLAGLIGARRGELARRLVGLAPNPEGTIEIRGRPMRLRSLRAAIAKGIAFIPDDRKSEGLFLDLSVTDNFVVTDLKRLTRFGWLSRRVARRTARIGVERFRIRAPDLEAAAGKLSGGNQQKLMLAKCLATGPDIIVIDEPTKGVDIGSKAEIHKELRSLAVAGKAILIVSSDLPELLAVTDRIVVMREGEVVGELPTASATETAVMRLAAGASREVAA